jgi:hypothetical protein
MSRCLVGRERCGCIRGVYVLGYFDVDAYKAASRWSKAGCKVDTMKTSDLPQHFYCDEHRETHGPPWWPRVAKALRSRKPQEPSLGL